MSGSIHFLDDALLRKEVQEAIRDLAALVAVTLGPGGRPVLLEQGDGKPPLSTKDGVTVARHFSGRTPIARVVANASLEVCEKIAKNAGDGPQPLYSKVLTPKGFIEMGDVRVGMEICGTNGTIQKVLGVFPKGQKEIYEIEIGNRGIVECCEDHLWGVTNCSNGGSYLVKPTSELIKNYRILQKDGSFKHRYFVPRTHVDFQENKSEMPLDPYLVGVLLGDGCIKDSGSIEISLGIKKKHIIEKLVLPEGISLNVQFVEKKNYFRVKLSGIDKKGKSIRDHVESIGLKNTGSFSKFIPKSYLYSSLETRMQLLKGLLDTDGHVNSRGLFEFSTVSEELSNDFIELTSSIGKAVFRYLKTRSTEDGCYSNTSSYVMSELKGYKHGLIITGIRPTGRFTEMQCIKVSNPDSLYITDNYVTTHNTSTGIILASALVKEGQKYLEQNPSISPQRLTRELRSIFLNKIKPEVMALSKPLKGLSQEETLAAITHVAKVSANHDIEIANAVAKGVDLVGENGMVIAEEGAGIETTVLHTEGFPINGGLGQLGEGASTAFINGSGGDCRLTGAYVLLYDGDILETDLVIPIINEIHSEKDEKGMPLRTPLVIFAHNYSDNVLKLLAQNFRKGTFTCLPLMTPRNGQSHYRQAFLHDVSSYVGGTTFDPHGQTLRNATIPKLGFVESIKAGRSETVLITTPEVSAIEERIADLQKQMENASEFDQDRFRYRIGQLTGGVATVYAGGVTSMEAKERHARVVDAISAVRSAMENGVVPGGGAALLSIAGKLSDAGPESIFKSAFMVPFAQIIKNAGVHIDDNTDGMYNNDIGEKDGKFYVFDALEMKYVDWWEAGILDPAKVTLTALENALSVAQLLMTLGGLVAVSNNEEAEKIRAMQKGMLQAMSQEG